MAFLLEQLGEAAGTAQLVGLYGLERTTPGGGVVVDPAASRWQSTVDAVAAAADSAAPDGLLVERKGLSVTLHFRQAPHLAGWAAAFAADEQSATGLVAQSGKQAWELRPPVPTDKGTVVAGLAAGLRAVCFVGDDTGDLPAFACARSAAGRRSRHARRRRRRAGDPSGGAGRRGPGRGRAGGTAAQPAPRAGLDIPLRAPGPRRAARRTSPAVTWR